MRHILFEIPFRIPWQVPAIWHHIPVMGYGLMIVLGFLFGIGLAYWRAKRCGENPEHIMNLGLLALIGGIIGARLFFVIFENPGGFTGLSPWGTLWAIVDVRAGGLVYYGGLLTATGLALIYIHRKKLSTRRILDILAPSLMLGLAFGRAGCTLNGCCWGGECTLKSPWAQNHMTITFPFASPAFDDQAQRLPWRVVNTDGQVFGYYVVKPFDLGDRTVYLRVPYRPTGKEPSKPNGELLDIPSQFLRPQPMAQDVEDLTWQVVTRGGATVQYYVKEADGPRSALPPNRPPAEQCVTVPQENVVDGPDGPMLFYSYISRDEIRTPEDKRLAAMFRSLPVYPAQIYGIANGLLLCWVLTVFFPRRGREGQVFALMLMLKGVSRFLLEAVRRDTDLVAFGLTFSQNVSLVLLAAGVIMWLVISRMPPVAQVPLSGVLEPAAPAAPVK